MSFGAGMNCRNPFRPKNSRIRLSRIRAIGGRNLAKVLRSGLLFSIFPFSGFESASGHRSNDHEWFVTFDDGFGQLRFGWLQRQILFAREEADEGPAFQGDVVA